MTTPLPQWGKVGCQVCAEFSERINLAIALGLKDIHWTGCPEHMTQRLPRPATLRVMYLCTCSLIAHALMLVY